MPYKIEGVDSNDTLYGNNPAYRQELAQLLSTCLEEILNQLVDLAGDEKADAQAKTLQAQLLMLLAMKVAYNVTLSVEVNRFLVKVLDLVLKNKSILTRADQRVLRNTIDSLSQRALASDDPSASSLVSHLKNIQV
jgi:hypothetical protein